MVESLCGTGQEEPHGVGEAGGRGGAGAVEVTFHSLDIVFTVTTGAVELFVQHLWRRSCERGDDNARSVPCRHALGIDPLGRKVMQGMVDVTPSIDNSGIESYFQ